LTQAQYQQSDSYNVDGQLSSGPGGTYTYGSGSHVHALTVTSGGYSAAYDAAGTMNCRAPTSSTTCRGTQTGQQLNYDAERRLTSWQNQPNSPTQKAHYLYDGEGHRVAMKTTVSGTNTTTAYIGSIEEVQTTGGSTQTTTFYTVGGKRLAANVNGTFYYFGYDVLGSQALVLNASGSVVGAQLFGPYGNQRYSTGTLPTSIGFTGQRGDSVTGLDYYVARYYDPVVGVFLSVDSVQGNAQGMNPYGYVSGNPETLTDPTGHRIVDRSGDYGYVTSDGNKGINIFTFVKDWQSVYHMNARHQIDYANGFPIDHHKMVHPCDFFCQFGGVLSGMWHNLTEPAPPGLIDSLLPNMCGTLSFAPLTKVETSQGKKAIRSLHPGERVLAYNPKTHKMEFEPVVHVWLNHDNDLVDVTIVSTIAAQHGKVGQNTSEVVHTNQKHPFLTMEKGFVPVSQLRVGMHVMKATGGVGTITMLQAIAGTMTMYNLEVAQDHTFTVGEGEWIVHNCGVDPVSSNDDPTANITMQDIINNPYLVENMTPEQVAQIAAMEGWVVGSLKQSQHGSAGISMNKPNAKGTDFTDQYIQYHEGGGYHGDEPYWKISSAKGGTVRIGPQFPRPSTGGDIPAEDIPAEDIPPEFIDP